MTAEEFDTQLTALGDYFEDECKKLDAIMQACIGEILKEAEASKIPDHLMLASATNLMKRMSNIGG